MSAIRSLWDGKDLEEAIRNKLDLWIRALAKARAAPPAVNFRHPHFEFPASREYQRHACPAGILSAALGVKQEFEKALAQDGKPTK
jgi:hypothetical protein